MPVKIVVKGGGSVEDAMAGFQKKYGATSASYGGKYEDYQRLPTGVFPLDLALGGGIPRGCCTIIYGPEDSAKTSLVFKTIATHQRMWPDLTCVFVAIEPFDGLWAERMGVNVDKLALIKPAYAEQAVDMMEQVLASDNCGLVAIDSLAAMITTQEANKSAEIGTPGGSSQVVGSLVRRTALQLREAQKAGRAPTLVYVNQTRFKVGVMMGDPETMPGGNAPRFQAQLRIRVYGKAIKDSSISDTYPVRREVHFVCKKAKLPLVADNGKFELVTFPHAGLQIGDVDDWNTVEAYLKDFEALVKEKKGWSCFGEAYPTLQAMKDRLTMDRKFAQEVKGAIITRVLAEKEAAIKPNEDATVDADGVVHA